MAKHYLVIIIKIKFQFCLGRIYCVAISPVGQVIVCRRLGCSTLDDCLGKGDRVNKGGNLKWNKDSKTSG